MDKRVIILIKSARAYIVLARIVDRNYSIIYLNSAKRCVKMALELKREWELDKTTEYKISA